MSQGGEHSPVSRVGRSGDSIKNDKKSNFMCEVDLVNRFASRIIIYFVKTNGGTDASTLQNTPAPFGWGPNITALVETSGRGGQGVHINVTCTVHDCKTVSCGQGSRWGFALPSENDSHCRLTGYGMSNDGARIGNISG